MNKQVMICGTCAHYQRTELGIACTLRAAFTKDEHCCGQWLDARKRNAPDTSQTETSQQSGDAKEYADEISKANAHRRRLIEANVCIAEELNKARQEITRQRNELIQARQEPRAEITRLHGEIEKLNEQLRQAETTVAVMNRDAKKLSLRIYLLTVDRNAARQKACEMRDLYAAEINEPTQVIKLPWERRKNGEN